MYAVTAIGALTIVLSLIMIANPRAFGQGILDFARKPYFHVAEIGLRLVLGTLLVVFAAGTRHPSIVVAVGALFLFAGGFLIVAGSVRHRTFAEKSAGFVPVFRPAGFASLAFGIFLVASALGWDFS